MCACMLSHFSHIRLFTTLWTSAWEAPLSMEFSRPEYWNGLPCLPPGDLPNPGIEPRSSALYADSLPSEPPGKPNLKIYFTHNIHNLVRFNMYTLTCHNHNQGNKFICLKTFPLFWNGNIPFGRKTSFSSSPTMHFLKFMWMK